MSGMKIVSMSGIREKGLTANKDNCYTIRMSDFNKICKSGSLLLISKNKQMIRILYDAKCDYPEKFRSFLGDFHRYNPSCGAHINLEFDSFFEEAKASFRGIPFSSKSITIYPDSELKNRDYLDFSNLDCAVVLPLQYIMWMDKPIANESLVYFVKTDSDEHDGRRKFTKRSIFNDKVSGGEMQWKYSDAYTYQEALRCKDEVNRVLDNELVIRAPHTDFQKMLLVLKYLEGKEYIDHSNEDDHSAYGFLHNKSGVCEGIAEAFLLLLNNPRLSVDCHALGGLGDANDMSSGHAWNAIKLKESDGFVFVDPTNAVRKHNFSESFLSYHDVVDNTYIFDCSNPDYKYASTSVLSYDIELLIEQLELALKNEQMVREGKHPIAIIKTLTQLENERRRNV